MNPVIKTASFCAILCISGCISPPPPPKFEPPTAATELEYEPYLASGTNTVSGQAFLSQRGGGVVKAAGQQVTLDPATTSGVQWWVRSGKFWAHRNISPQTVMVNKNRTKN